MLCRYTHTHTKRESEYKNNDHKAVWGCQLPLVREGKSRLKVIKMDLLPHLHFFFTKGDLLKEWQMSTFVKSQCLERHMSYLYYSLHFL